MIRKIYAYLALITLIFICSNQLLLCTTLTVTNLLDNNSAGSLRTTITNAASGDTIIFSVAGTINLNPVNGELLIDKMLTIDGDNQIAIDGDDAISTCLHITGSEASNSLIINLTIQYFKNVTDNGLASGILIDNNANNCSVNNCTITHIQCGKGENAQVFGILAREADTGSLTNNTISYISSENNQAGTLVGTGIVTGIGIEIGTINGNCSHNTIHNLSSGNAAIGNTATVIGIGIPIALQGSGSNIINGNISHNYIHHLTTGNADIGASGGAFGIATLFEAFGSENILNGNIAYNSINHLTTGSAAGSSTEDSGPAVGLLISGFINGNCSYNSINNITSGTTTGTGSSNAGFISGIIITDSINGSCLYNSVQYLTVGNGPQQAGFAYGIVIFSLTGDCLNNFVADIYANNALAASGISLFSVNDGAIIACNNIANITDTETFSVSGIEIVEGNNLTIANNTINSVKANNSPAHGLLLGGGLGRITSSLILSNTVSNITGANLNGFGITLMNTESTSNDMFSNRIFDGNGKAINSINNGVPVDATVTLISIRCTDGCKLIISGNIIQFIAAPMFKIQFFVSDKNTPQQAKTFIGEYTYDASNSTAFKTTLSHLPQIEAGQFITATATALIEPHNNTSEVSNALVTCKPFGGFCPCPLLKPTPQPPCPSVNCGDFIL